MRERPKPHIAPYRPAMVLVRQKDRQNPIQLNRKATVWRQTHKHAIMILQGLEQNSTRWLIVVKRTPAQVTRAMPFTNTCLVTDSTHYESNKRISVFLLSLLHSYWKGSCCFPKISIKQTEWCHLVVKSKKTTRPTTTAYRIAVQATLFFNHSKTLIAVLLIDIIRYLYIKFILTTRPILLF